MQHHKLMIIRNQHMINSNQRALTKLERKIFNAFMETWGI